MPTNMFDLLLNIVDFGIVEVQINLMKLKIILALALSLSASQGFSIERPDGTSGEVSPTANPTSIKEGKPLPKVGQVKFGVVPGVVPQVLLSQLQLNGFPGAVVESVIPDSPAAKVGLEANDVIVKIGDRPIAGPQDISKILSEFAPGDKVNIEFYHQGKKKDVEMVLQPGVLSAEELLPTKDGLENVRPMQGMNMHGAGISPQQMNNNAHARAMQMLQSGMNMPNSSMHDMMQEMEAMRQAMQQRMGARSTMPGMSAMPNQNGAVTSMMHSTSITSDSHGAVVISRSNDKVDVKVMDAAGKVLYEGPYNTDEEKAKVPADVKARLSKMGL